MPSFKKGTTSLSAFYGCIEKKNSYKKNCWNKNFHCKSKLFKKFQQKKKYSMKKILLTKNIYDKKFSLKKIIKKNY